MKEKIRKAVDGEAERKLEEWLAQWSKTLPEEFTVGTVGNGNGRKQPHYPDLHFKADAKIPGSYYADLDQKTLGQNGNGAVVFAGPDEP